jgi:hypothetical protein
MIHIQVRCLRGRALFVVAAVLGFFLASVCVIADAATIVNLTTAGSSGTINGAIYEQIDPQATGTGGIDSFVQQSPQGNDTTSKAYNTTANNVLDNKSADNFNHSILLSDVPSVVRSGIPYRWFLLDINENSGGGNEFISLDEVQIFAGGTANSSVDTFTGGILDHDGTLVYRMDAGMDNWVAMDYSLNSGSGSGDMFLLVPASDFAGFGGSSVVTLYSQFGLQGVDPAGFTGDFGSSGGFEEWALPGGGFRPPVGDIPEPATAVLMVGAAACLAAVRRRRR